MLAIIKEINHTKDIDFKDFEFNWSMKSEEDTTFFCAQVENETAGLAEFKRRSSDQFNYMHLLEVAPKFKGTTVAGELLAMIALDSFLNGFDGFIVFEPKTALYNHYIKKYGATPVRNHRLKFDTEASLLLIKKYMGVDYHA